MNEGIEGEGERGGGAAAAVAEAEIEEEGACDVGVILCVGLVNPANSGI